jgi:hypothetical protein
MLKTSLIGLGDHLVNSVPDAVLNDDHSYTNVFMGGLVAKVKLNTKHSEENTKQPPLFLVVVDQENRASDVSVFLSNSNIQEGDVLIGKKTLLDSLCDTLHT